MDDVITFLLSDTGLLLVNTAGDCASLVAVCGIIAYLYIRRNR